MKVSVSNLYQSLIEYDGQSLKAIGPLSLLNRLQQLKEAQGVDPKRWILKNSLSSNDEIFIQEFLDRLHARPPLPYLHEELCHCRMVTADRVHQAIKQGCRDVKDIARTTLAGTGCGTCRKETENIFATLSGTTGAAPTQN